MADKIDPRDPYGYWQGNAVPGHLGPRPGKMGYGIGSDWARDQNQHYYQTPKAKKGKGWDTYNPRIRALINGAIRQAIQGAYASYGGSQQGGDSRGGGGYGGYGSSYGAGGYQGGVYGGAGGAAINQGVGGAYKNR